MMSIKYLLPLILLIPLNTNATEMEVTCNVTTSIRSSSCVLYPNKLASKEDFVLPDYGVPVKLVNVNKPLVQYTNQITGGYEMKMYKDNEYWEGSFSEREFPLEEHNLITVVPEAK